MIQISQNRETNRSGLYQPIRNREFDLEDPGFSELGMIFEGLTRWFLGYLHESIQSKSEKYVKPIRFWR